MAGAESDGSFLDPRGDTPDFSTYTMGGIGSNDPLIDWASNMNKDDLAKFIQDPEGTAKYLAAKGVTPPPPEAMNQIHQHNESMGTPTRAASSDIFGPMKDPSQGNLTDPISGRVTQPRSRALGFAGTEAGDVDSPWQKDMGKSGAPDPNAYIPRFNRWRNPNDPTNIPAPPPPTPPAQAAPAPSGPVPLPASRPAGADTGLLPGADLDQKAQDAKQDEEQDAGDLSLSTPEGRNKIADSLSTIGKAMQGVKAPEPLKPPNIGAPSVRSPTSAGAANISQLLQTLGVGSGRVPASALPVLRALGR
jgi:hypothetical protein